MTPTRLTLLGGFLTGLLLFAVFPPLDYRFLAPFALIPLLYALVQNSDESWQARWLIPFFGGWIAGTLQWGLTCSWIRDTLAMYGGLTGPLSWLAIALFAVAKGLHLAVLAALAKPFLKRPWGGLAVAALWTGIERTHGPLGFTWLLLGNAGIDMALPLRLAPVTGVYGLSFVFVLVTCAVLFVLLRRPRWHLLYAAPLVLLWLVPPVRMDKAPKAEAVSLQPAISETEPITEDDNLRMVRRLSFATLQESMNPARPTPQMVLWPEAPAPFYYYDDPAFREQMDTMARLAGVPTIFGGVARTPEGQPLNSAFFLNGEGHLSGRYDKRFLVPFGEFIPPLFGWINKISHEAGDFAAGTRTEIFTAGDHSIGPFICYEAAFPHLVREVAATGANVFVNLSNDGYFGRSAARTQHLLLARMRAVENHRWLLRSTNDGITVSIDPAGRIWDRFPEGKRIAGRLRFGWESGLTAYTQDGDWFAWSCLGLGLAAAALEMLRLR
jgi:apolipoprotein N-acyltransferase